MKAMNEILSQINFYQYIKYPNPSNEKIRENKLKKQRINRQNQSRKSRRKIFLEKYLEV